MSYDHIEKVLAEIIVEVTGEPRIGRFERAVAKSALARLRECGMTLVEPDVEAGAREAFFTDDAGGHIRGGFTWDTIPEVGRENYRTMVRGVLHAALADVEIRRQQ